VARSKDIAPALGRWPPRQLTNAPATAPGDAAPAWAHPGSRSARPQSRWCANAGRRAGKPGGCWEKFAAASDPVLAAGGRQPALLPLYDLEADLAGQRWQRRTAAAANSQASSCI